MLLAPLPDLSPAGFDMGLAWTGAFRLAGRGAFEPDFMMRPADNRAPN
jgi:hypothetical protein